MAKEIKYDLGFGKMGNKTTIYNRLQQEYGDYKIIAHISESGKINWRVNNLPEDVKNQILSESFDIENTYRFGQNEDFMNYCNNSN